MWFNFKKFDVHVKAIDGVNQKTLIGAIITIISVLVVIGLLVSELSFFLKVDVVSRMIVDNAVGVESVKLDVDITFFNIPCQSVVFAQEITRGTMHLHEPGNMDMADVETIDGKGCRVVGSSVTDKVGGNFRFGIKNNPISKNIADAAVPFASPLGDTMKVMEPRQLGNFSHRINHVAFYSLKGKSMLDKLPEFSPLLSEHTVVFNNLDSNIYQYSMLVSIHKTAIFISRLLLPVNNCACSCDNYTGGSNRVQGVIR
jgi:hypothetical protein